MTIGTDYSFAFGAELCNSEKNGLKNGKAAKDLQPNIISPVFDNLTKKTVDIQRTNAPFRIDFLSA